MDRSLRVFLVIVGVAALSTATLLPLRASEGAAVAMATPPAGGTEYVPGEVIVEFRTGTEERMVERDVREVRGREARQGVMGRRYLVSLDRSASVSEAVRELSARPEVDYAEPNRIVRVSQARTLTPNDPRFAIQWNFKMIGAERTWGIQEGNPSVAIAVLDTGIAYEDYSDPRSGQVFRKAPDWGNVTFLPGYDFINNDSHPNDDFVASHGTHVASTIAEATNNALSFAGLAHGCSLMPVKVIAGSGSGTDFAIAEGIDYAINFTQNGTRPVKVINMSIGGPGQTETLRRAVERAVQAGVVLVAAAGNSNSSEPHYPAAYPGVIAVGAVDARKQRARYSSFGPDISVVAPGGDCDRNDAGTLFGFDCVWQQGMNPSAVEQGRYDVFLSLGLDGTSTAAPHVSALAALLVSQGITDASAVRAAIESTAEDLGAPGRDDQFGHGLIRPAAALTGMGLNK